MITCGVLLAPLPDGLLASFTYLFLPPRSLRPPKHPHKQHCLRASRTRCVSLSLSVSHMYNVLLAKYYRSRKCLGKLILIISWAIVKANSILDGERIHLYPLPLMWFYIVSSSASLMFRISLRMHTHIQKMTRTKRPSSPESDSRTKANVHVWRKMCCKRKSFLSFTVPSG